MATKKYRPYLTLPELETIHTLTHQQSQISPLTLYLKRFIYEIKEGLRQENLALKPTLRESLELDSPAHKQSTLTPFEREQQRRYLNDEMLPEEEMEYEKSQGISI